ncbi:relaxase/mobilization nuclease RlxS [Sphingomonas sp. BE137]|jgi:type IV secretory pathway VirD2 relaxase|uniref:relaxase/mobilization nuclease RlxS n=1 Tax=Sphingomonas sp. BE137 TaxID=2817844 RepID=UPI001AE5F3A8|nr:relaxase/mobilization nuclease RlxS [Sphingomonas sp. BE137]MDR6846952.1 type IV secretory pathway VirD2 relaxase [Sphingomonas sp. BE137]
MADDDSFEPRLGRQRQQGGKRARRYLGRVLAAANLARGGTPPPGLARGAFSGTRIGRGAGVGRMLASRGGHAASNGRRVIVKASIVKLAGKGASAAAAHLRYLQRDGTTREGERGTLYGRDADTVDGKAFGERGAGDRHQFRFIVSPEDGDQYDDLKPLTRRLLARMEEDLGTRLNWVAVDHFNTGHPHTHIVVRGKDDRGADLVIARDYMTTGIRERAAELVDLDLGPRTHREIAQTLRTEVEQERLTSIDRALLKGADAERVVATSGRGAFDQTLRAARLAKLSRLGLAEPLGAGRYRLAPDLAETLRALGERGDIIRTMQREFSRAAVERAQADQAIYDPAAPDARPLVGRVLARGLADEHADRHYLIVDGVDGRSHYVAIGQGTETDMSLPQGAIVRIDPISPTVREVDRTIATVAAANGGRYDVDAHLRHDPTATQAFAETHVRRLEAMRRISAIVEREPSGRWIIAPDHLTRVAAHEAARLQDRPVAITMLSAQPLDRLVDADAATWIDRELVSGTPIPARDAGFGHDLRDAQARRRQWLVARGFAEEAGGGTTFPNGMVAALQRRELLRVAGELSDELKLPFREAAEGARIEGVYRRSVDLVSGRFAVIERARDFTLVPWRPALDRQVGKSVSGLMRGDGISWSFGRGRSGPTIS